MDEYPTDEEEFQELLCLAPELMDPTVPWQTIMKAMPEGPAAEMALCAASLNPNAPIAFLQERLEDNHSCCCWRNPCWEVYRLGDGVHMKRLMAWSLGLQYTAVPSSGGTHLLIDLAFRETDMFSPQDIDEILEFTFRVLRTKPEGGPHAYMGVEEDNFMFSREFALDLGILDWWRAGFPWWMTWNAWPLA